MTALAGCWTRSLGPAFSPAPKLQLLLQPDRLDFCPACCSNSIVRSATPRLSFMLELRGLKLLHISSPATSVAFRAANELYVGSEDGSVRLYNLTSTKVVKAVSKLGGEVTGIIPTSKKQNQLSNMSSQVWITSENMVNATNSINEYKFGSCTLKLYKFDLYCDKMILGKADALKEIVVGVDSDDAINDVSQIVRVCQVQLTDPTTALLEC